MLRGSEKSLNQLRKLKIMVFGGTGFIGKWFVSTLITANIHFNLGMVIVLVSRDPQRARSIYKDLIQDNVIYVDLKDLRNSSLPICDIYIHAATPTTKSEISLGADPKSHTSILEFILESAKTYKHSPIVMHLSSGAVYGAQEMHREYQLENNKVLVNPSDLYSKAKLEIEDLLVKSEEDRLIRSLSPRLFAFAGPQLPLDAHFAVGNFISDGIAGKPISVLGNSLTRRSYLYPTDLIHVLIELLIKLPTQVINVGSDQAISMLNLANLISQKTNGLPVHLMGEEREPSNYVPSIENLRLYVSDREFLGIDAMIDRWLSWLKD